jgi:hypothetical protein
MMKRYSVLSAALVAMTLVGIQLPMHGQTEASTDSSKTVKHTKKHHKETAEEIQLREMREALKAQQAQIDALKEQIAAKNGQVTAAQQTATDAQTQAAAAAASAARAQAAAAESSTKVDAVSSSVTDLKSTTAGLTETVVTGQKKIRDEIDSPTSLHYKGVTITPVAFFAFEGVWRQRSVNSGINTPFNSIPFPGSNEGHVSELNFSGRQSRLGAYFEGNAGTYKLAGYFEGDFLSGGTTSNSNQSNSYTLRQRQFWGQAGTASGFTVTGGQMWSLVTETGKGTDARTEKLPATIDPQYMVGFNWTRQPGIRVQQKFGDYKTGAFTLAVSAENAQITSFTAASGTSGAVPTNYYFAGTGTNGGLYNNTTTYANNVSPDFMVKAAFDMPKMHVEVGGIARFLRDYYYPILTETATSPTSAVTYTYGTKPVTNTATAGGVYGSVRVSPIKFFDVAFQGMGGTGVGRYGSAQLADATVKPSGALEPIRNYHGLFSLETHPAKKLDVFAYYGGEYAQRTVYTIGTGAKIGYGTPNLVDTGCYGIAANPGSNTGGSPSTSNCNSPTRYIQEGMFGFTYRLVSSPKYGRLQYSATYQLIQRNLWSGVASGFNPTGPRAQDSMIHIGMRYYIP